MARASREVRTAPRPLALCSAATSMPICQRGVGVGTGCGRAADQAVARRHRCKGDAAAESGDPGGYRVRPVGSVQRLDQLRAADLDGVSGGYVMRLPVLAGGDAV